jgi:cell division protease FtsH
MPDRRERLDILTLHAKNKPLEKDVELDRIAAITAGLSGADIKNIINEAAILTVRNGKKIIAQHDLREAVERVAMGPERKSHRYTDAERKMTAYHEAGHAIISHVLPNADDVEKITIIPRGMAGGYTLTNPPDDRHFVSENHFKANLAVLMGGWVAEELVFKEMTTGASSDLTNATKIARDMVTRYGMSKKLGARTFGEHDELIFLGREISEQRNYSESVATQIDIEVRRLIDDAVQLATSTLKKYKSVLDVLAEKLLKEESVDKRGFGELFNNVVTQDKKAIK